MLTGANFEVSLSSLPRTKRKKATYIFFMVYKREKPEKRKSQRKRDINEMMWRTRHPLCRFVDKSKRERGGISKKSGNKNKNTFSHHIIYQTGISTGRDI